MTRKRTRKKNELPSILGTGLIALDVVLNGNASKPLMLATGGTCGNVLTNLAFLGWSSYPLARISHDWAGLKVKDDLEKWGVSNRFLHMEPLTDTPIVIHRIHVPAKGIVTHSFSMYCPNCRRRLPGYRPVTIRAADSEPIRSIQPKVFFFDRSSPGALRLAKEARDSGALIVFELSGKAHGNQTRDAFELAHLIKYSESREAEVPRIQKHAPFIEVVTRGKCGLSFRCKLRKCRQSRWQDLDTFSLTGIKDTAGAGDWCTAGLIDRLGIDGVATLNNIRRDGLNECFRYAQAFAAVNCLFEGARGSMYALSQSDLRESVESIVKGKQIPRYSTTKVSISQVDGSDCPICSSNS